MTAKPNTKIITPGNLTTLVRYDPENGKIYWLPRSDDAAWTARFSGKEALTANNGNGYLNGSIYSRKYFAHRVAWAVYYGSWPALHIDHVNGDKADNRIANLRECTPKQNGGNSRPKGGSSSFKGVSWSQRRKRWIAEIWLDRKVKKNLGQFQDEKLAAKAYDDAARSHFGRFARLNLQN